MAAKKRNIIILAEGVETIDEIDVLLRFGVDLFQGYFFAKPSFDISPVSFQKISLRQYHKLTTNFRPGKSSGLTIEHEPL